MSAIDFAQYTPYPQRSWCGANTTPKAKNTSNDSSAVPRTRSSSTAGSAFKPKSSSQRLSSPQSPSQGGPGSLIQYISNTGSFLKDNISPVASLNIPGLVGKPFEPIWKGKGFSTSDSLHSPSPLFERSWAKKPELSSKSPAIGPRRDSITQKATSVSNGNPVEEWLGGVTPALTYSHMGSGSPTQEKLGPVTPAPSYPPFYSHGSASGMSWQCKNCGHSNFEQMGTSAVRSPLATPRYVPYGYLPGLRHAESYTTMPFERSASLSSAGFSSDSVDPKELTALDRDDIVNKNVSSADNGSDCKIDGLGIDLHSGSKDSGSFGLGRNFYPEPKVIASSNTVGLGVVIHSAPETIVELNAEIHSAPEAILELNTELSSTSDDSIVELNTELCSTPDYSDSGIDLSTISVDPELNIKEAIGGDTTLVIVAEISLGPKVEEQGDKENILEILGTPFVWSDSSRDPLDESVSQKAVSSPKKGIQEAGCVESEDRARQTPKLSSPTKQSPIKKENSIKQQSPVKTQAPVGQQPSAKQQLSAKQQSSIRQQPPVKPIVREQLPTKQQPPAKQQLPVKQSPSIKQQPLVKRPVRRQPVIKQEPSTKQQTIKQEPIRKQPLVRQQSTTKQQPPIKQQTPIKKSPGKKKSPKKQQPSTKKTTTKKGPATQPTSGKSIKKPSTKRQSLIKKLLAKQESSIIQQPPIKRKSFIKKLPSPEQQSLIKKSSTEQESPSKKQSSSFYVDHLEFPKGRFNVKIQFHNPQYRVWQQKEPRERGMGYQPNGRNIS